MLALSMPLAMPSRSVSCPSAPWNCAIGTMYGFTAQVAWFSPDGAL